VTKVTNPRCSASPYVIGRLCPRKNLYRKTLNSSFELDICGATRYACIQVICVRVYWLPVGYNEDWV